jgi:hypothetical protein
VSTVGAKPATAGATRRSTVASRLYLTRDERTVIAEVNDRRSIEITELLLIELALDAGYTVHRESQITPT